MSSSDRNKSSVYDVIVIGAGPAGLTAGLYLGRGRLKTLLLESTSLSPQAVVTEKIENYPGFPEGIGGFELVERFRKQTLQFGTEIVSAQVTGISHDEIDNLWQVYTGENVYSTFAIVVASGARPRKLGVPGEEKLIGRGVSYCATCDGAFFKGKDIVVVGGGDTAAEEALFLTRFGRSVTVIHRRNRLRATKILQERILAHEKIKVVWDSVVREVVGEDKVEAVKVENLKSGEVTTLSCDGVFIFVGYTPNTDFLKGVVNLDDSGYVMVDERMQTSQEGIFACGDCRRTILRQVVTACGDGAFAAFSAQQYVEELKGIAYK